MATLPLTYITMNFVDPSGIPLQGVAVTAELSSPIIYQEIIVPVKELATTDRNGFAEMSLIPSNLTSVTGHTYSFTIEIPGNPAPLVYYDIVVPDSGQVTLQYLLGWPSGGPGYVFWAPNNYWSAAAYWSPTP